MSEVTVAESRYGVSSKEEYVELPHGIGRSLNPLYFMESILPERLHGLERV